MTQWACLYGVDGKRELNAEQKEVNGHQLSAVERKQRRTRVHRVQEKGFQSVMDEVAYTCFNLHAALRYMEVNGILPTRVRVFTDYEGAFQPQILTDCLTMDNLERLNKEIVFALKEQDQTDELYKYLLISQYSAIPSATSCPRCSSRLRNTRSCCYPTTCCARKRHRADGHDYPRR